MHLVVGASGAVHPGPAACYDVLVAIPLFFLMCPSTLCSPLIGDGGLCGQRFLLRGANTPHGLGLAGALEMQLRG